METRDDHSKKGAEPEWVLVQPGLFPYPVTDNHDQVLLGNRCTSCGRTFFPTRVLCPICFDQGRMQEIRLERRGIIYASTVVHINSPSGIKAPYAYGYVDLPGNALRVFSLFTGAEPTSFKPGREVEVVLEAVGTNREGKKVLGYKFRPASEAHQ